MTANFFEELDSIVKMEPDRIVRQRVDFDNGYAASIITGPGTYGGDEGLYEVGVMYNGSLVYDTPVTDDVIGWLDEAGVKDVCAEIKALPAR